MFFYYQIETFDVHNRVCEAKLRLRSTLSNQDQPSTHPIDKDNGCLPHFEVDIFIDEVKPFSSSDASGIIPILGRIHSVSSRFEAQGKMISILIKIICNRHE